MCNDSTNECHYKQMYDEALDSLEHSDTEIQKLEDINSALHTKNEKLEEQNDKLQKQLDDEDTIVENYLSNHKHSIVNVVMCDFEMDFKQIHHHSYGKVEFVSEELENHLKGLEEKHAEKISEIEEEVRLRDCEIERLTCIVGMLRMTSTVPNAEEIADGKNQVASK